MFLMVMVLVLRVPFVCEYSHDRHAKKNAALQRSAMCWENVSSDGRLNRCRSSWGVMAFWGFSLGSDSFIDLMMERRYLSVFPSTDSLGSDILLS